MDDKGTKDITEFLNISKDDALAWPTPYHRTYPSTVNARMESTIRPFIEKSLAINHFLIDVLNDKLGLPKGALADLHQVDKASGCTARCIKAPPMVERENKTFLNPHTDFGSLVRSLYVKSWNRSTDVYSLSCTIAWEASKSCRLAPTNGTM